jgi:rod shape-determining protein MreC
MVGPGGHRWCIPRSFHDNSVTFDAVPSRRGHRNPDNGFRELRSTPPFSYAMESLLSRFKNVLVLIAILLAQTIALATQINRPRDPAHPDGPNVRLVRLWALALVSPFERLSTSGGHGIRSAWADYIDLRHVRQQNKDLRRQIDDLRLQRAALAEDALEAQRLRTLLGFRQSYGAGTVVARVIGTSGSDQSRLLTLDKGSADGLRPEMPVITPTGIAGKLRDVFPHTAQLLLISDPNSGAGVILASTRIHAIIRGSVGGRVVINNLTPDSRIKTGETVLTSGGDGVFPRGLPVGTVESIAIDPRHQPFTLITLHPAVDLTQLDEVLVVTSSASGLDPQAQQDLAADPLAHAADISAERLPSLHDDKPAEPASPDASSPAAPPPDKSTELVPKPRPVLHPDRYSPGAAPPAADLTPGAPKEDR